MPEAENNKNPKAEIHDKFVGAGKRIKGPGETTQFGVPENFVKGSVFDKKARKSPAAISDLHTALLLVILAQTSSSEFLGVLYGVTAASWITIPVIVKHYREMPAGRFWLCVTIAVITGLVGIKLIVENMELWQSINTHLQ